MAKASGVVQVSRLARMAVDAAPAQMTALPGEEPAAAMVVRLAKGGDGPRRRSLNSTPSSRPGFATIRTPR